MWRLVSHICISNCEKTNSDSVFIATENMMTLIQGVYPAMNMNIFNALLFQVGVVCKLIF